MGLDSFAFIESCTQVLSEQTKLSAVRRLTKRTLPLYVRGGDYISGVPLVSGTWEPEVVALLRALAADGYNQALFDIGANIGLTTYQALDVFQKSYCFEPNPRVFHVLCANLYGGGAKLFDFGIGDKDEASTITVPKKNFAGAFIRGNGNAYTDAEQAQKEALESFNPDDFDELPIQVRRGRDVLAPLFHGLSAFVLKIDAEGYEQTILREVASALPAGCLAAIVFENLSPRFDAHAFFLETFKRSGQVQKMVSTLDGLSGIHRRLEFLRRGRRYFLTATPAGWVGNILYLVGNQSTNR